MSHRLIVLAAASVLACRSSSGTERFAAQARVEGLVRDADGHPLPGVDVQIRLPEAVYNQGYVQERMETGADGHFSVAMDRLPNAPALGSPDTITGTVVATASGLRYQPLPAGGFRSDSVRVTLLFGPWGKAAPPTSANITLRVAPPQ